jgi:hypothetical protein
MRNVIERTPMTDEQKGNVVGWIWAWIDRQKQGVPKAGAYLKDSIGGFCCLGNLCDLAVKNNQAKWDNGYIKFLGKNSTQLDRAIPAIGWHRWEGRFVFGFKHMGQSTLAMLNDLTRITPEQIGEFIEENADKIVWPWDIK